MSRDPHVHAFDLEEKKSIFSASFLFLPCHKVFEIMMDPLEEINHNKRGK